MDSLTAFLLNEDSSLPFDSFNESMLQNLPHRVSKYDIFDPVVPFQNSNFPDAKAAGIKAAQDTPAHGNMRMPWEFPLLQEPAEGAAPYTSAAPAFLGGAAAMDQPQLAHAGSGVNTTYGPAIPMPQAGGAPQQQLPSTSSGSSEDQHQKEDPDYSKLHERIQKQKEKNARNQRQFRKRAKERAIRIEEQVQQLSAKLSELESEKQGLAARNRALEAALASAKGAVAQHGPGASLASLVAAIAEGNRGGGDGTGPTLAAVTLRVREGAPVTLTAEQLARLTWPELVRIWKEYVNAIAMGLVTGSSAPGSASAPRLQELIQDIMALMHGIATHNTLLIHQHISCRMDGLPHSPPDQSQARPAGFYAGILAALNLSADQREALTAHRHIKLASLARLVQERRELHARLQDVNDAAANASESVPLLGLGRDYPHLLDVTQRLSSNVAALHRSVCLFMGQTWRQVLTPVQAGTFMVQAFPWAPDMLALANAVAAQDAAPSVAQIFAEVLGKAGAPEPAPDIPRLGC